MKTRHVAKGFEEMSDLLRSGRGQRGQMGTRVIQSPKRKKLNNIRWREMREELD